MNLYYRLFSKKTDYNLPEGFTVTAHAGANKTKANTIPSLKVALKSGAEIVEFDLNVTENGELTLSHNAPKNNNTPSFEEALLLVKEHDGIRINIDVKTTAQIDKAQEIILKHDMLDRVFYTGIKESFVADVKAKSPEVPYYINCYPTSIEMLSSACCDKMTEHVIELGGIGVNINYMSVTPQLVEACRKKNLLLSIWTINKKSDMKAYLAMGPDNITTKRPTVLKNMISE